MIRSAASMTILIGLLGLASCTDMSTRVDSVSYQESACQRHFGPYGIELVRQSLAFDLNDDGHPERIVLLSRSIDGADTDRIEAGLRQTIYVEGFEVYSGTDPDILLFYAYRDDRFALRFDTVDGRDLLVSDGGRDHVQYVWGWWDWHSDWRGDGWVVRYRVWTPDLDGYGAWRDMRYIRVSYGK